VRLFAGALHIGERGGSLGGSSTGEQGMEPSQDATGVKGAPDSTNGPSDKKPGDTDTSK